MRTSSVVVVAWVLLSACGRPSGGGAPLDAGSPGDAGVRDAGQLIPLDGFHQIDVTTPQGAVEQVWLYVASPPGDGPFPVVVYGHGQGSGSLLPSCAEGPPTHADVAPSQTLVNALAAAGYVGVAVFYRSHGAAVQLGELRMRDHHVLDARALLAAASWARDRHGKGSPRVVFLGHSMGSYPATWTQAPVPALADLQQGLELRGAVASGMFGNHVSNTSPQFSSIDDPTIPASARATAVALYLPAIAALRAQALGRERVSLADLDALSVDLTARGKALLRAAFLDPPPARAECPDRTRPVYCSESCANRVFTEAFAGLSEVRISDWFAPTTAEAFAYWDPPTQLDPTTTTNSLLRLLVDISPAYSLPGPLKSPHFLPLLSRQDHTLPPQLEGSMVPVDGYLSRLRGAGADFPSPLTWVDASGCDHNEYFLESRPDCGFARVKAHLQAAFP